MSDDPAGGREGQPAGGDREAEGGAAGDSRAEHVLAQALRLMAGGDGAAPGAGTGSPSAESRRRLTTGQLLLLAAILGLLLGIGGGFVSLLL